MNIEIRNHGRGRGLYDKIVYRIEKLNKFGIGVGERFKNSFDLIFTASNQHHIFGAHKKYFLCARKTIIQNIFSGAYFFNEPANIYFGKIVFLAHNFFCARQKYDADSMQ